MFEFGAGRFSLSDATGIVFSQINDGIYAKYSLPIASVSMYGGITRLLKFMARRLIPILENPPS